MWRKHVFELGRGKGRRDDRADDGRRSERRVGRIVENVHATDDDDGDDDESERNDDSRAKIGAERLLWTLRGRVERDE